MYNTFSISHSLLLFLSVFTLNWKPLGSALKCDLTSMGSILPVKVLAVQLQWWQRTYLAHPEGKCNLERSCQLGGPRLQNAHCASLNSLEPTAHHFPAGGSACFLKIILADLAVNSGGSLPTPSSYWLEGREQKQGTCVWCDSGSGLCKLAFARFTFMASPFHRGLGDVQWLVPHHVISECLSQNLSEVCLRQSLCSDCSRTCWHRGGDNAWPHSTPWTPHHRNTSMGTCPRVGWPCTASPK